MILSFYYNGVSRLFFHKNRELSVIIFRYLCKEVLGSLLATTLVFLVILIMNQFVHYLNDAASGQITMTAVMQVMALQVPLLLGFLLPLGLFIGVIMAFGRLYVDHEMTVMTACGISRLQLLMMAMIFATGIAIVVAVLMLWAEPKVQWYRTQVLERALATASLEKMLPGRFQSIGKKGDWTFYAAKVGNNHKVMTDVFMANKTKSADSDNNWDLVTADEAYEEKNSKTGDMFLVFNKGYRSIGTPGQNDYQIVRYDKYGLRITHAKPSAGSDVKYMSTSHLRHMPAGDKDAAAELQWRLAMPISVWLFALMAVPLSYTKPRHGRYVQLIPAILIYIIYADLMFVGRAWIEQGTVSTLLGLWWLHGLMLLLGIGLVWRFIYGHRQWMPSWLKVGG